MAPWRKEYKPCPVIPRIVSHSAHGCMDRENTSLAYHVLQHQLHLLHNRHMILPHLLDSPQKPLTLERHLHRLRCTCSFRDPRRSLATVRRGRCILSGGVRHDTGSREGGNDVAFREGVEVLSDDLGDSLVQSVSVCEFPGQARPVSLHFCTHCDIAPYRNCSGIALHS